MESRPAPSLRADSFAKCAKDGVRSLPGGSVDSRFLTGLSAWFGMTKNWMGLRHEWSRSLPESWHFETLRLLAAAGREKELDLSAVRR